MERNLQTDQTWASTSAATAETNFDHTVSSTQYPVATNDNLSLI